MSDEIKNHLEYMKKKQEKTVEKYHRQMQTSLFSGNSPFEKIDEKIYQ